MSAESCFKDSLFLLACDIPDLKVNDQLSSQFLSTLSNNYGFDLISFHCESESVKKSYLINYPFNLPSQSFLDKLA